MRSRPESFRDEARAERFSHSKSANYWRAQTQTQPDSQDRELNEILADWMTAYADADAEAEQAFRALVNREKGK